MAASSLVSPVLVSPSSTTIWKLPDELLVAIFKFLTRRDQLPLQLVCRRFLHVARDPALWRCIVVRPPFKTQWPPTEEADFIDAIRRATLLISLQCSNIVIQDSDALFSALATSCPLLQKLCVPHSTVARKNVAVLVEKCPNLTELNLNVRGPDDYDAIKQLKKLRLIRVRGSYWGYGIPAGQDMLLKQLAKRCVHLEEVHIDDAGFGVDSLEFIATEMGQRLKGLTLKLSDSVEKQMRILDKFVALQDLTLRFHPNLSDPCFAQCSRLKYLKSLKIECEGVDQAHLYDFFYENKFEQLRTLKLKKTTYLDDTVLAVMYDQFAHLEELHIVGPLYMDNEAIYKFLTHARYLRVFKLSNLPDTVTATCLAGIHKHCPDLTSLKVKLCDHISRETVEYLARRKPGLSALLFNRSLIENEPPRWFHYHY